MRNGQPERKIRKIGPSPVVELHSDIIFCILQYLGSDFVIENCYTVCKHWKECIELTSRFEFTF